MIHTHIMFPDITTSLSKITFFNDKNEAISDFETVIEILRERGYDVIILKSFKHTFNMYITS